jgi:hypothetical protein
MTTQTKASEYFSFVSIFQEFGGVIGPALFGVGVLASAL